MFLLRGLFWLIIFTSLNAAAAAAVLVAVLYQRLPALDDIIDYRPRLPMRIYNANNELIGEFGEERRTYTKFKDYPPNLANALLATEDVRFFEHYGFDSVGIMRAALGYAAGRREGASTITMQVARNFYLKRNRTVLRKLVELMLALKIEQRFSKREILERYMNQIYLGHGSYGFAAAAHEYYGKEMADLTTAEIAVLAGLPKSPSSANPRSNTVRAKERQKHVLRRMLDIGLIDETLYLELVSADLPPLANSARRLIGDADYVAEEVRRIIFEHFGDDSYERGLRIYTTVQPRLQQVAIRALRDGLLAHEHRRAYPGPEKYIDVHGFQDDDFAAALRNIPTIGGLQPAIVLKADKKSLQVLGKDGEQYVVNGDRLKRLRRHLPGGGKTTLRPGAIVRLAGNGEEATVESLPGAQAALVALATDDGAVLAMVGGFDFADNQFNHALQARRQPGSAIKPMVFSAALEKGLMPANIVPDTPIFLSARETGSGESWQPKNYDGKMEGLITIRRALIRSKNLATIHLLKHIGALYGRDYLLRFGFRPQDHPPYLTMALGAGAATPMEMARAYAAFSNGGYLVHPYIITRVEDYDGNIIVHELDYQNRRQIIDRRNAFIVSSMLKNVITEGTGGGARNIGRNDIGGKTGTTNDTRDAWFVGFGGNITTASWIGYGQGKSLGDKETGARAALPIWRDFMAAALEEKPEVEQLLPAGVIEVKVGQHSGNILSPESTEHPRQEYFYAEYLPDVGDSDPAQNETEQLL